MAETEQAELTVGLYYIVVGFGPPHIHGRRLTDENGRVTISPPSVDPDPRQEWLVRIVHGRKDILIIERPILGGPVGTHLSYDGAPEKPKKHEKVVLNRISTEWHRVIAPGFTYLLRVNASNLGIAVEHLLPPPLDPPLWLDDKDEIQWVFRPVQHPVE